MTAISTSTIFSQSWTLIKDFLKTNLTDPITGNANSSRKWVYNRIPTERTFGGFPFITISSSDISDNWTTFSPGTRARKVRFVIDIYSLKVDNTGSNPQIDTISDNLIAQFDSDTSLSDNGLNNLSLDSSPSEETTLNGKVVLRRTFTLEFDNVMEY